MNFNTLTNFIISISLGALIGIERQRGKKDNSFAGIRTFILISFFGSLTSFLYKELNNIYIFPIIYFSIVSLIVSSYIISALKGYVGITSEISALIIYFLGFLVMFDEYRKYAVIFTVLITILLSFKNIIHEFAESAKENEWNYTLKFALIAFVILPLLPQEINFHIFPEGKFYNLNIINPKEIWLLVVFVCAIGFLGYFLIKIFGKHKGPNIIGALGGLVSSTAVTQSMANFSKTIKNDKYNTHKPLVSSVIIATVVSFIRFAIIILTINKDFLLILIPLFILIFFGIIIFFYLTRNKSNMIPNIKLKSPFKLGPALFLGFIFLLLTFISKLFYIFKIGKSGILLTSIVTGFFEVDPVILTIISLYSMSFININDSICAILLGIASNQITKSIISLSTGSKSFGVLTSKILMLFVTIIILIVISIKFIL